MCSVFAAESATVLKLALRRTLRRHDCASRGWCYRGQCRAIDKAVWAGVAQLVEHLICNQRVGGSSPFASSSFQAATRLDLVVLSGRSGQADSGDFFKDS